jgi:hypothetical protein
MNTDSEDTGVMAMTPESMEDSAIDDAGIDDAGIDDAAIDDAAMDDPDWGSDATSVVEDAGGAAPRPDAAGEPPCENAMAYASEVVSFEAGANAGYGQADMPGVALGPPLPGSPNSGSLDVVSLGVGGEIILGFGGQTVVDGPGADLIVWENPFWVGGDRDTPFAELGEVAVSFDGETWHAFPCDVTLNDMFDPGCAGWRPRADFDPCERGPLNPEFTGGDAFDLADLGLDEIRFVRIRDLADSGAPPSAGFDFDAVGAVYLEP